MRDAPYRLIPLRDHDGKVRAHALVDAEDYARLARYRWHLGPKGYVARNIPKALGGGSITMHREVCQLKKGDGREVDHWNRDKLDNQRSNLRIVPHVENARNRGANVGAASPYRGVTRDQRRGKWMAKAGMGGRTHNLGRYVDETDAARAVNAFWTSHGYAAPNDLTI